MSGDRRTQVEQAERGEEPALLARVRAHDLAAFERLYRLYHPRLSRFVTSLVRRHGLVEEVVDDTMMVLWDKPESFSGGSKLSTWLFAIAYRKAVRARLRADDPIADEEADERIDEAALPDRSFDRQRAAAILQHAIGELSPDHRAVVHLTYFQEMNYREIADILGCPIDTVKTRMFHARRYLRTKLAGELSDWI